MSWSRCQAPGMGSDTIHLGSERVLRRERAAFGAFQRILLIHDFYTVEYDAIYFSQNAMTIHCTRDKAMPNAS